MTGRARRAVMRRTISNRREGTKRRGSNRFSPSTRLTRERDVEDEAASAAEEGSVTFFFDIGMDSMGRKGSGVGDVSGVWRGEREVGGVLNRRERQRERGGEREGRVDPPISRD